MSTTLYTELELRKLKGQTLKDVWHKMIGKDAGIRNVTGLKSIEEIVQAILKGQQDKEFLNRYVVKTKHKATQPVSVEEEDMPGEKKKRGPKPKSNPTPIVSSSTKVNIQAVESNESPIQVEQVERLCLRRLQIDETVFFIDVEQQKIFEIVNNAPGNYLGIWNPETKEISYDS